MPRKMSEMLKEMSEVLMRNPDEPPSSEAAHVALFFANLAWNECVGLDHAREGCRHVWEEIEADNPTLWNEFKSNPSSTVRLVILGDFGRKLLFFNGRV